MTERLSEEREREIRRWSANADEDPNGPKEAVNSLGLRQGLQDQHGAEFFRILRDHTGSRDSGQADPNPRCNRCQAHRYGRANDCQNHSCC